MFQDIQKNEPENVEINDDTTVEEQDITAALRRVKNRKSPGQDNIPNELLKYGGDSLITEITSLVNKI